MIMNSCMRAYEITTAPWKDLLDITSDLITLAVKGFSSSQGETWFVDEVKRLGKVVVELLDGWELQIDRKKKNLQLLVKYGIYKASS